MKPYHQYVHRDGQLRALARDIRSAVAEVEAVTGQQRPANVHYLAVRQYVALRDEAPLDPALTREAKAVGSKVLAFAGRG